MKGIFNKMFLALSLVSVVPGVYAMGPVTTISLSTAALPQSSDAFDKIGATCRFAWNHKVVAVLAIGLGYCAYRGAKQMALDTRKKFRAYFGLNAMATQTEDMQIAAQAFEDFVDSDDEGSVESASHVSGNSSSSVKSFAQSPASLKNMLDQLKANPPKFCATV